MSGGLKAAGSQVFGGFRPAREVDRYRNSISAYAGLENQVSEMLTVDVGGRVDQFSDFGSTASGKLAMSLALQEKAGSARHRQQRLPGSFPPPGLVQQCEHAVRGGRGTGELVSREVLTANNRSAVVKAFGIGRLTAETSVNLNGGITTRPFRNLSISADYYRIAICDRIVTRRFSASNEAYGPILEPFGGAGVTQAQFFANAVNTPTSGLDLDASYGSGLGKGALTLSAAASLSSTTVRRDQHPRGTGGGFRRGEWPRPERRRAGGHQEHPFQPGGTEPFRGRVAANQVQPVGTQ